MRWAGAKRARLGRGGVSVGTGDGGGGIKEGVPNRGEAGRPVHDGTCVLAVENETGVLEDAGSGGGFEFACGLRRSFGNLRPEFVVKNSLSPSRREVLLFEQFSQSLTWPFNSAACELVVLPAKEDNNALIPVIKTVFRLLLLFSPLPSSAMSAAVA